MWLKSLLFIHPASSPVDVMAFQFEYGRALEAERAYSGVFCLNDNTDRVVNIKEFEKPCITFDSKAMFAYSLALRRRSERPSVRKYGFFLIFLKDMLRLTSFCAQSVVSTSFQNKRS